MATAKERHVVWITGAAGNVGSTVATLLLAKGAQPVLIDRSEEKLRQKHGAAFRETHLLGDVDFTDSASLERAVATTHDRFGPVDAVVHTVGAYLGDRPAIDTTDDELERMLEANLRTFVRLTRAVVPGMVERRHGRIVCFASADALEAHPGRAAYASSKAALLRYAQALAADLHETNVTVHTLAPTTIGDGKNRTVSVHAIAELIAFLVVSDAAALSGTPIPLRA